MKFIYSLAALMILVSSCQKEITADTDPGTGGPGGGTGNTNGRLTKVVIVTGNDTLTSVYTYDSQGRLETQTDDGKSGGIALHNFRKLVRDASGRIVRILQKIDQNGIASDTAINNIHYPNATTMEFDYSVNTISLMGMEVVDSSVYTYSGGKMTRVDSYMSMPLLGFPAFESSRHEFTYDASGRVSLMKQYGMLGNPGDPLDHITNQTFTYGNLKSFSYLPASPAQRYLVGGLPNGSDEVVVTHQIEDFSGTPGVSRTLNTTYVLSNNKPVSATMTSSLGQVSKYTFYYQ